MARPLVRSFVEDTLAQASKAGGRAGIRVFEAILCCNHDRVVDLDVAVHLASVLARRSINQYLRYDDAHDHFGRRGDRNESPPEKCTATSPDRSHFGNRTVIAMSSLQQRLRAIQTPIEVEVQDLSHLTLEELSQEKVSFGQKHLGQPYAEAWKDQEWVTFMVSRYGGSTKLEHRRFMKYIDLKVTQHETHQMPIPVVPPDSVPLQPSAKACSPGMIAAAKPKARGGHSRAIHLPDMEEGGWSMEPGMEPGMYTSATMTSGGNQEMEAMQQRILNMENALTRVIRHLETQHGTTAPPMTSLETSDTDCIQRRPNLPRDNQVHCAEDTALAGTHRIRKPASFARSEVISPEAKNETEIKRRRLSGKQGESQPLQMYQSTMTALSQQINVTMFARDFATARSSEQASGSQDMPTVPQTDCAGQVPSADDATPEHGGKLFRSAPEHIRLALPEEGQGESCEMPSSFVEDTLAQASKAGGRAGIRVFEAILCCNHDRVVDLDVAVHLASVLARRSLPTAGGETVERLGARAVEGHGQSAPAAAPAPSDALPPGPWRRGI
ncbi:unnamed protein product [Cladocopium goreaui]|uniref:Uncharacterized protein n=1 Tax=Cladocopium goreaui TaxID=2562237 RepID=A0A9P1CYC0_9DINO|nr:unnamed protein product [Cladocopium goreaui]